MDSASQPGSFRWIVAKPGNESSLGWAHELNIPEPLAQCLLNRGFDTRESAASFLEPRLAHLGDPFLLPEMSVAVERLCSARSRGEKLVIFGDYDVDGVTATAILQEYLAAFGWQAACYLPHRVDEGYGLSLDAVQNCLAKFSPSLLLAVDCGSSSHDAIQELRSRNVDVIILDHHQVGSPRPLPFAFVNPHLSDGAGASGLRNLCSAGLAFKLAHALLKKARIERWPGADKFDLKNFLDLVALGTVADMVPLQGENRIFVKFGLERLEQSKRPGVVALKRVAQVREKIGAGEIGFQLGPRLNAAGRLETALDALELLLSRDASRCEVLAQNLDLQNRERQAIEQKIVDQVLECVRARFDAARDYCIVEGDATWHLGVVGIVASRILREFHRPVIILGGDGEGTYRGSGRSVEGFDLGNALRECGDLLLKHGGHAMAAGVSIAHARLEDFRARLNDLARRALTPESMRPALRLDAELKLSDLTFPLLKALEKLEPTGSGNYSPRFAVRNLRLAGEIRRLGTESRHLKFMVSDGAARREAVWWNGPSELKEEGLFDLAFAPELNEHNGSFAVQLRVLDLQFH